VNWLSGTAFEVLGQTVIRSDLIGNLLGLAALALGWRRAMAVWPVQLLSGVILVSAYWSAHLSGGVGKQLLVIVVAVWGWTQWRRGRGDGGELVVRFADRRERGLLVVGTAIGTLAVGGLFSAVPSLSWDPWPDAYIFVGTLAAMIAQARGLVEFWFAWLAVDLVGVPLAFRSGLAFSGLVYGIYFVLVILGMRAWWIRTRAPRPQTGAVLEGTAA
jgi:nicotinamide mononucleotide transporter